MGEETSRNISSISAMNYDDEIEVVKFKVTPGMPLFLPIKNQYRANNVQEHFKTFPKLGKYSERRWD